MLDLRVPADSQLAVPMRRDEFYRRGSADELPRKSEWYDGLCVVTGGSRSHGAVTARIVVLLAPHVATGHTVLVETGWKAPAGHFVPDVLVCADDEPGSPYLEGRPVLVVEVLSPSTRRGDLTRKRELYGLDGAAWYWVVDPEGPAVVVFERRDGNLVEVQRVGAGETGVAAGPYPVRLAPDELVERIRP